MRRSMKKSVGVKTEGIRVLWVAVPPVRAGLWVQPLGALTCSRQAPFWQNSAAQVFSRDEKKKKNMSSWRVVVSLVVVSLVVCVCTWSQIKTTTPSPCLNTAPVAALDFRSLPPEVKRFGKELFGSRNNFLRLLNRTLPPTAVNIADGRCMWLVQHPRDNSLQRLSQEVPKDQYHLARLHFPISRGGLMVDVGANLGDQSIAAHLWDPGLQVLAIEPVPLTFLFLLLNLHLNAIPILTLSSLGMPTAGHRRQPGVVPLHAAVADKNNHYVSMRWSTRQSQDAAVDLSAQGGTAPGGAGKKWSRSQVKAIYLPALLQGVNAPLPLRLLTLDCEGCEYLLVASSSEWFADRRNVLRVTGERHPYLGTANRKRETLASKVPVGVAMAAEAAFKARGCRGKYALEC